MTVDWEEKNPAFQFYARDWLTDLAVRRCSYAARGLWADALCLMWLSPKIGHLETDSRLELCRLFGGSFDEISPLIDELISKGVASSNGPGSLISRRMAKYNKISLLRSKAGQKGMKNRWQKPPNNSTTSDVSYNKTDNKHDNKRIAKHNSASATADAVLSTRTAVLDNSLSTVHKGKHPPVEETDSDKPNLKLRPSKKPVSPVLVGCEFFRMSDHERTNVQDWYRKKGFPIELIEFSIEAVENWLGKDSARAIKARTAPTHFRYLYEEWVLEKATRAHAAQRQNGVHPPATSRRQIPDVSEIENDLGNGVVQARGQLFMRDSITNSLRPLTNHEKNMVRLARMRAADAAKEPVQ